MSVFANKIYFQLIYMANKMAQNYSIFWIAHIVLAISPDRILKILENMKKNYPLTEQNRKIFFSQSGSFNFSFLCKI